MFYTSKKKTAVICIAVFMFIFILCTRSYAFLKPQHIDFKSENTEYKIFSEIVKMNNVNKLFTVDMFLTEDLDSVISMGNLYVDGSKNLKGLCFKYTGNDSIYGINLNINGNEFEMENCDSDNNYIYRYFNTNDVVLSSQSVEIYFSRGNEKTEVYNAVPIEAVEGKAGDWEASSDGHTLYFYKGNDENIVVPNFYENKIISCIGGYNITDGEDNIEYCNILYKNNNVSVLRSVSISKGIRVVGDYAFNEIEGLESISIPDGVEIIGGCAFSSPSLTGNIVIPESVREIYAGAFYDTDITGVTFKKGIERICSFSFSKCDNMKCEINLPEGLNYLGECAFSECSKIYGGITIPSTLKEVGYGAFYGCTDLDGSLVLSEGVEKIGALSFAAGSAKMKLTEIQIPKSLREIGAYAFQYCSDVKSIELNEGLRVISDGAFNHMSGLETEVFVIPSTVEIIGGNYDPIEGTEIEENTGYGCHVFYDMGKNETFKRFEVEKGNEYFTASDGVLYNKEKTRLIAYPRGKGDTVFEVPEGIVQMDELCFSRAAYLKKLILPDSYIVGDELPKNVLNSDANTLSAAVYTNTSINEIGVKDTNKNYAVKDGILYSKELTVLYYIPNQYEGEVNIPDSVVKIGKACMFAYNKGNTKWTKINIPESVIYIDDDIVDFINAYFKDCYSFSENIYYGINDGGEIFEKPYTKGDVNMDGNVNNEDSALILKYIMGTIRDTLFNVKAADVNEDIYIDLTDAVLNLK